MIESFRIQNFRCFADLTIGPLGRVNLITGKNNAGKTALLEALFLYSGKTGESGRWLELVGRSSPRHPSASANAEVEGIKWLFRNRQQAPDAGIVMEGVPQGGKASRLSARILADHPPLPGSEDSEDSEGEHWHGLQKSLLLGEDIHRETLVIELVEDNQRHEAKIRLASGASWSTTGQRGTGEALPCRFLPPASKEYEKDLNRFSQLKGEKRDRPLIDALRLFEPRLSDLQILVAPEVALHGEIGIGRMLPISLMGDGVQRLASILMAGIAASKGFLLVDEVENGIHHSVLKQVFEVIGHAARENDVQIFATTHSYECIQAAQAAFAGEHANDLRLHRLEMVKGELKAITYPGDVLQAALDMEREVR
jgi:hypothetical protein